MKNDNDLFYTLSSVFPTMEINDVVRRVIDRDNKRNLCCELGIFEDKDGIDIDLISWEEIIKVSNSLDRSRKRGKILTKFRGRIGDNYGK